ncbi:MAG: two component sigma54 specific transcriptional regulator Fis family [Chitinophagaceae bacterium]|nr:MAG: two component sigma54 specific transcriptional regulator Fis family [Chitinophagaceae bacterium]
MASSELFGHEKGSFTGAIEQKIGMLELADGGTVFLDEVSNLSYEVQVSLLRVVQQRKIRRIGGKKDIEIDIRIIVASNEQLWQMTQQGKFREDLFHRFNEFSISLPPLRNRKLDIEAFSSFFLTQSNVELEKNVEGFKPEVMLLFLDYAWPGNLRELKNTIKRAALLESTSHIQINSLPVEMLQQIETQTPHPLSFILSESQFKLNPIEDINAVSTDNNNALKKASIGAEYEMILDTIKKVKNNKSKAANLLQIDRKTLYNKLKLYKAFSGQ